MPQELTLSLLVTSVQILQKYSNRECQFVHTKCMQRIDWGIVCLKESSATERMWLGENGERGVHRSRSGHFLPGRVYIQIDSFSLGCLSGRGFQPSHCFFFSCQNFWRSFRHGHSLQLILISSALDIGEVSSIWFSLHLRNFSATEKWTYPFNRTDQVIWSLARQAKVENSFKSKKDLWKW